MRNKIVFSLIILASCLFQGCTSSKRAVTPSLEQKEKSLPAGYSDSLVARIVREHGNGASPVLADREGRRVQVIYTQINRDQKNQPLFKHYYYNLYPGQYFYPASTVKLPVALLALQKLNELSIPGLDRDATMITGKSQSFQTPVYNDPSSEDGRPTIAQYIKKIFLVSDNDAYNRLYEFLGTDYINSQLHRQGYDSTQIRHRLSIFLNDQQNRTTNPVLFYDTAGRLIYHKPETVSTLPFQNRTTKMGKGFMSRGKLVNEPFDFSTKNRLTLSDLHSMLLAVIFPEAVPKGQRLNLGEEDYRFLYRYMSMKPSESRFPQYDSSHSDAYVKFLLYGGSGKMQDSIRIFNKVGDAYGFLTDVAYIVDFKNGVEFLLSATIYCNSDGVFNDDRYDYNSVGFPFMKNLGNAFYQYELKRNKKVLPDPSWYLDSKTP